MLCTMVTYVKYQTQLYREIFAEERKEKQKKSSGLFLGVESKLTNINEKPRCHAELLVIFHSAPCSKIKRKQGGAGFCHQRNKGNHFAVPRENKDESLARTGVSHNFRRRVMYISRRGNIYPLCGKNEAENMNVLVPDEVSLKCKFRLILKRTAGEAAQNDVARAVVRIRDEVTLETSTKPHSQTSVQKWGKYSDVKEELEKRAREK